MSKKPYAFLRDQVRFLRCYLQDRQVVGAIAPSSRALAEALVEPYRSCQRPARILEVGAGTGAVTRHLGGVLRAGDELDICEMQPAFAEILRREVLSKPPLAGPMVEGRVRLWVCPLQQLQAENDYDFVISSLPLTAFALPDVEEVFLTIRRCLKPDGVLSYFEYVGLRRVSRVLAFGGHRSRVRPVSSYLSENIRKHQFRRRTVLRNLPPAHARHLRFD